MISLLVGGFTAFLGFIIPVVGVPLVSIGLMIYGLVWSGVINF